jgi:hypothetical protein
MALLDQPLNPVDINTCISVIHPGRGMGGLSCGPGFASVTRTGSGGSSFEADRDCLGSGGR